MTRMVAAHDAQVPDAPPLENACGEMLIRDHELVLQLRGWADLLRRRHPGRRVTVAGLAREVLTLAIAMPGVRRRVLGDIIDSS